LRDQMEPAYGITGELALSGQLLSVKESSRSTWKQAAATFHCEERRGSCSGGDVDIYGNLFAVAGRFVFCVKISTLRCARSMVGQTSVLLNPKIPISRCD
jgi:hypothetical protein